MTGTDSNNVDLEAGLRAHIAVTEASRVLLGSVGIIGDVMCEAFAAGHRVYAFGNGGSAAEAQHLVAEFVGRFRVERRALPAISLTTDPSVVTSIGNDYDFDQIFARQVTAMVGPGDVVVAFTTSGRSPNIVRGLATARAVGATTVLFGAGDGADAAPHADHRLLVPTGDPARAQEVHLLLLHLLSDVIDRWAVRSERDATIVVASILEAGGGEDDPGRTVRASRGPPA